MKKQIIIALLITFVLFTSTAQAKKAKAVDISAQSGIRHTFICADYVQNKYLLVSAEGKILWDYDIAVPQDVWVLPNGNFLLSNIRGAQEVTKGKRVVWEYKSPDGTEVHNCQPLPNGRVMIAECGTSRIIEVDRAGVIRKELKLDNAAPNVHLQFRMARKLSNGNYLVAYCGENAVKELNSDGEIIRTIKAPTGVYSAIRLPNGNTLIGGGYGCKVIEVDPKDRIVWQIDENDIPGIPLRFVAGVQRLSNGNTIVSNWGGSHIGEQPHVFEITRDKKVVWKLDDYKHFLAITNIFLMDDPDKSSRPGVIR
ncbi:MAG: beta-propeller domain-containing protein [Armatimonadota bacterium]